MAELRKACIHGKFDTHYIDNPDVEHGGDMCAGGPTVTLEPLEWCIAHESVRAKVRPDLCHFLLGGPVEDAGECVFRALAKLET